MRVDHKTIRVDHKKVWEKLSAPGLENAAIYSLWQDTALQILTTLLVKK